VVDALDDKATAGDIASAEATDLLDPCSACGLVESGTAARIGDI